MKRYLAAVAVLLLGEMLTACGGGKDIMMDDFTDFSYMEEDAAPTETIELLGSDEDENTGSGGSYSEQKEETVLIFESFDGGGPEFNVIVDDEEIVACRQDIRYNNSDHDKMTGAGKNVVIVFVGVNPGETKVLIEERSPIADNLDRRYKVKVDDELNVSVEEISVRDINEVSEDMRLYINGEEVPVTWAENESVEELKGMMPITVQMSGYGGFEQVGPLGDSITRNDEQITTEAGDIVLYSGNQIVIFYGSNRWAYTRLGHVDLSNEELTDILGKEAVEVTLE